MKDKLRELEARIRQLHALDLNAVDICTALVPLAPDRETRTLLENIARDEARHVDAHLQILKMLGRR